jgi:hypothetical protein
VESGAPAQNLPTGRSTDGLVLTKVGRSAKPLSDASDACLGWGATQLNRMDSVLEIPAELYVSEISFTISCFWDDGFYVAIGIAPDSNESAHVGTYVEACRWLKIAAIRHYPQSDFARK